MKKENKLEDCLSIKKIKINNDKDCFPKSNWVIGSFEYRNIKYSFEAKIFHEGSMFGINNGNVSKLWVRNIEKKKEVFVFDRGLVIGKEKQMDSGMIKDLVDYLYNFAQVNWPADETI